MSSDFQAPGTGVFSCTLCAPQRPPARRCGFTPLTGSVEMLTGFLSSRASSSQTSFGQSAPSSWIDSSVTTYRSRPKSGSTVWVKPL